MRCYSSLEGVHSQLFHFYVLVFPINNPKCFIITSLGFISMLSAAVTINCSGNSSDSNVCSLNLKLCFFFRLLLNKLIEKDKNEQK